MHALAYSGPMKVIKGPPPKPRPQGRDLVAFRLDNEILNKIDAIAHKMGVSKTTIVEAILKQALNDPKFVLRLP